MLLPTTQSMRRPALRTAAIAPRCAAPRGPPTDNTRHVRRAAGSNLDGPCAQDEASATSVTSNAADDRGRPGRGGTSPVCLGSASGDERLGSPFDEPGGAHAAAHAHRDDGVAALAALELV